MSTIASVEVSAGTDALASQYNVLRDDLIQNAGDYATTTGSANAFVLAVDSAAINTAYVDGWKFRCRASFAVTGASTLNVNSIGARNIMKNHDVALESGDIESGQAFEVVYRETEDVFQLLTPVASDLMTAQKTTLSAGVASDADTLHTHTTLVPAFDIFHIVNPGRQIDSYSNVCFSHESGGIIAFGASGNGGVGDGLCASAYKISTEVGYQPYKFAEETAVGITLELPHILYADGHFWAAVAAGGTSLYRDSSGASFGSNACAGAMSWDDDNSYLLFCNTTTNVRRFTYAATTLTFVDNITLDTAVTVDKGFVFDNTNNMYYFLDTTNNVVRKFNASGVQQTTFAYTLDDNRAKGLVLIGGRIYVAISMGGGSSTDASGPQMATVYGITLIPLAITI